MKRNICLVAFMKRCHRLLSTSVAILAVWIAVIRSALPEPLHTASIWALPAVLLLVCLHLAFKLLHGVITFPSCPEEEASLRQEIEVALEDLAQQGLLDPGQQRVFRNPRPAPAG